MSRLRVCAGRGALRLLHGKRKDMYLAFDAPMQRCAWLAHKSMP